jgi:hypothetical protein
MPDSWVPTAGTAGDTARGLLALAWANVALHGAGLALAVTGMRPGSPLVPLAERMAYLAGSPAGWTWGWGVWMVCSLLLTAYMVALERALPGPPALARLAVVLTAAGMAADLLCDVLQIGVLPLVAAQGPPGAPLFLALERLALTGGLTVANGLYTTGVLLMTLCLRRAGVPARLAGFATAAGGYVMAAAGLIPAAALAAVATGPTILFYSLWTVLVARGLRRPEPVFP